MVARLGDRVGFYTRLPDDLLEWYRAEADKRDVSVNHLITKAARQYRESETTKR